MDPEKKEKIKAYLSTQLANAGKRLVTFTVDQDGQNLFKRNAYLVIDQHLRNYRTGQLEPRWIAIPGLRGTGKTTLLAQVFTALRSTANEQKLYVSLDDVTRLLGSNLSEILEVYEEVMGIRFEHLGHNFYLFIDEVHYDENWGITLKILFERTKKVFILCTGSSALSLQTNADIARRVVFEKLYPLSFCEYILIKHRKKPIYHLGQEIYQALFASDTSNEVHRGLSALSKKVYSYWSNIDDLEIQNYLKYGTLPSALQFSNEQLNEQLIYSQINQTLNNVLNRDVPQLNKFDKTTVDKLSIVLYLVSGSDTVNFSNISKHLSLDIKTTISIFDALEKTEVLIRIYPYGAQFKQVRKPSKYLFSSPAYRSMYHNLVGSTLGYDSYKGKLLEDIVACYLIKKASGLGGGASITYDSAEGGADFIIGMKQGLSENKKIVIEVGMGKKGYAQATKTLQKVRGSYGLVISESALAIKNECVCVPLKYFLLI